MKKFHIVATDLRNRIGTNNIITWNQLTDLKRFRDITINHAVIMGSNTFKSLGYKPLPNRQNVILTTNMITYHSLSKFVTSNVCIVYDPVDSISLAYDCVEEYRDKIRDDTLWKTYEKENDAMFIIGGASVFKQTINDIDVIYQTVVYTGLDEEIRANDSLYPSIEPSVWRKSNESVIYDSDSNNDFRYQFIDWVRR